MSREDSNSDTFEIIDKKIEELSTTDSLSSMSSSASLFTSSSISTINVPSPGNILSNVQPPSGLPSFVMQTPITSPIQIVAPPATIANPSAQPPIIKSPIEIPTPTTETFYPTKFSAAIPPNKGIRHGMESVPLEPASPVGDNSGFLDWMRGAVGSSGEILSKVAEKAKNSVDSVITTLDPQMREIIYSGGNVEVLVASMQEVKVSAIREAFQSVFGKATIEGIEAQAMSVAAQPVGFAPAEKAAQERIQSVLSNQKLPKPFPVVAIESFIVEIGQDKWYDLAIILLNDPIKQVSLQTFTQMTPVPSEIVALAREDTPADYPLKHSGLKVTIGSLMGSNLHVSHKEWHAALTGVSRRETILHAAKVLATLYKNSISSIQ